MQTITTAQIRTNQELLMDIVPFLVRLPALPQKNISDYRLPIFIGTIKYDDRSLHGTVGASRPARLLRNRIDRNQSERDKTLSYTSIVCFAIESHDSSPKFIARTFPASRSRSSAS